MTLLEEVPQSRPPAYPSDWQGTPNFDTPICQAIGGRPQIAGSASGDPTTPVHPKPLFQDT